MAVARLAVTFAVLWLVVTAQECPDEVTVVGAFPATAAVIDIVGAPVKPT
jgi:hypothetical protein